MSQKNRPDDSDLNREIELEKRKISELFREIKTTSVSKEDERINWMYKNPTESVDREEYLLGRNVDKALEAAAGRQEPSSQELANYSKRIIRSEGHGNEQIDLPRKIQEDPLFMIRQKEMDARRQWLNNPLKMKEIKRIMEIEAKKKLKAERLLRKAERRKIRDARVNLLLMKTLKKLEGKINLQALLQERSDDEADKPKKKKRKKESSSSSASSSESASDSEDRDSSDEKAKQKGKPKKSSKSRDEERHRKKRRDSGSEGARNHRSEKRAKENSPKNDKKKMESVKSFSVSDDGFDIKPRESKEDVSERSRSTKSKIKKDSHHDDRSRQRETNRPVGRSSRKSKRDHSSSSNGSSADERRKSKEKKSKKKREKSIEKSSSDDEDERRKKRHGNAKEDKKKREDLDRKRKKESDDGHSKKKKKNKKSHKSGKEEDSNESESSKDEEGWSIEKRNEDGTGRKIKTFGLSTIDGSKPRRSEKPITPYVKKEEKKQTVVVRRAEPVSEAERERQLREMTENAKERKKEREVDYRKHRQLKEKEERIDDYDEEFLRKEMSKLTGHGSMADRIKSKRNNLQRSGYSMEQSFVRK